MYENNNFFNPCYHQQPGMTYPHDQDLCDHVPDIEGTPYGREYSYVPDYVTNNTQNYNNYYEKNDHGCNGQTFNQCFPSNYESPQAMLPISTNCCTTNQEKFVISEEDRDPVKRIFDEISAECEHLLLKKNCEECRTKPNENFEYGGPQDNSLNLNDNSTAINTTTTTNSEIFVVDEETTQLALSMKRKREQNKMAAARYREKRKTMSKTTKVEIVLLEERNLELKKTVKDYQKEINVLRKKLNLPLQ